MAHLLFCLRIPTFSMTLFPCGDGDVLLVLWLLVLFVFDVRIFVVVVVKLVEWFAYCLPTPTFLMALLACGDSVA